MAMHPLPALLMLALAPSLPDAAQPMDGMELAQLTIHQRIVIRIPRIVGGRPDQRSEPPEWRWVEKRAPKCLPLAALQSAIMANEDSVDLIIEDGSRLRARFDDKCPAINFYSGLYLKATADGMVCARRDSIRARSGSACRIESFKRLVLKRK